MNATTHKSAKSRKRLVRKAADYNSRPENPARYDFHCDEPSDTHNRTHASTERPACQALGRFTHGPRCSLRFVDNTTGVFAEPQPVSVGASPRAERSSNRTLRCSSIRAIDFETAGCLGIRRPAAVENEPGSTTVTSISYVCPISS
jgi:hypothetical protein